MTKIIGLTGGIGSGKTMVANYFKSLGVPVYIADDGAKEIMKSPEVIQEVVNEFGDEVVSDGELNREKLAQVVFDNPERLQKLNSIVHPKVKAHFENWVKAHNQYPFVIKEAAILFESGSYKNCDRIITVISPFEARIERVINRDGVDRESVLKRIQNQWTDEQRVAKSDFVIQNTTVNETKTEVKLILKKLENL